MRDHPAVLKYAHSFAATTGIELDDLLQEGRVAVERARLAAETGQYDPHVASFDTYATHCVYRRMCSAAERGRRRVPTVPLDDDPDGDAGRSPRSAEDRASPGPDRGLLLAELVRELPEDARAIVDLVLGDGAGSLVDAVLRDARGAREKLETHIRHALGLRRGDRAAAAFGAATAMLAEMGT